MVEQTLRIAKPGGAVRIVTEDKSTIEFLLNQVQELAPDIRPGFVEYWEGLAKITASGAGELGGKKADNQIVYVLEMIKNE